MNVLVAGATGKTGRRLVSELQHNGHSPIALVRSSSHTRNLPPATRLRQGDLTNLQAGACDDCQAVVFAAGSGATTDATMTEKVDCQGAKRLVDLAVESGVSRFVMLSSAGAGAPDSSSELKHYLRAKHEADEHLMKSGLTYAIVRPVSLSDRDGTREICFEDDVDRRGEAARGDVAAVLASAVDDDEWVGKATLMQSA